MLYHNTTFPKKRYKLFNEKLNHDNFEELNIRNKFAICKIVFCTKGTIKVNINAMQF